MNPDQTQSNLGPYLGVHTVCNKVTNSHLISTGAGDKNSTRLLIIMS